MQILLRAIRYNKMIVDLNGAVVCSPEVGGTTVYKLLKFSQQVASRYGLSSSKIASLKDLEGRMDRAITGLEYEIYLQQGKCNRLMDQIERL